MCEVSQVKHPYAYTAFPAFQKPKMKMAPPPPASANENTLPQLRASQHSLLLLVVRHRRRSHGERTSSPILNTHNNLFYLAQFLSQISPTAWHINQATQLSPTHQAPQNWRWINESRVCVLCVMTFIYRYYSDGTSVPSDLNYRIFCNMLNDSGSCLPYASSINRNETFFSLACLHHLGYGITTTTVTKTPKAQDVWTF